MITTATKVAVIKATIFGRSNNDNKTEFYQVKVNHLKPLPIAIKKVFKMSLGYQMRH